MKSGAHHPREFLRNTIVILPVCRHVVVWADKCKQSFLFSPFVNLHFARLNRRKYSFTLLSSIPTTPPLRTKGGNSPASAFRLTVRLHSPKIRSSSGRRISRSLNSLSRFIFVLPFPSLSHFCPTPFLSPIASGKIRPSFCRTPSPSSPPPAAETYPAAGFHGQIRPAHIAPSDPACLSGLCLQNLGLPRLPFRGFWLICRRRRISRASFAVASGFRPAHPHNRIRRKAISTTHALHSLMDNRM